MPLRYCNRNWFFLVLAQFFLAFGYVFLFVFFSVDTGTSLFKFVVLFQFLFCVFSNYLLNRWVYNIYGVFLILFFVFLLSRVFLDVIGVSDFSQTSFFSSYHFSYKTVWNILVLLLISLVSLNVGLLLNGKASCVWVGFFDRLSKDSLLIQLGRIFFYIGLVPTFAKILLVVFSVARYGYMAIFLQPELFQVPVYISLFSMFFTLGFIFCHLGKMSNIKELRFITLIFIGSVFLEVLVGKRGAVLTQLLVLLWFYTFFYGKFVTFKSLFFIALFIVVLSQAALGLRSSKSNDFGELMSLFLYQQGVSVQVIGYMFRYKIPDKYEFETTDVFRPFVQNLDIFMHKISGASYNPSPEERMRKYNNYAMIVAYEADPKKFSSGFGMGGSYIAESFLLWSWKGVFFINVFLGYFFSRVEFLASKNKLSASVLLFLLPNLVYLPRGYLLEILNTELRPVIMLLLICFFVEKWRYRNEKK